MKELIKIAITMLVVLVVYDMVIAKHLPAGKFESANDLDV